jgi:4-oxalocrotonate tautomerase family enzyme
MPIITVQFIKDVVATPEQKRELIIRLTDTFVDILGDVVRPFVYCIIQETPQQEWGIAGVPMPDLVYLTGEKHAGVVDRSNEMMRGAIAQMQAAQADTQNGELSAKEKDRRYWQRWFDELWNKKNYDIVYEYVDDNFTAHGAGGQQIKMGPAGPRDMVKAWHAAMPDGRMTIDDIITEGELSTIRMTWEATHTGQFGEIPASGKRIKVTSTGIDRVVNGKITEGWGELDMLGMLQQMGAIPSPGQPAAQQQPAAPQSGAKLTEEQRVQRNREVIHRFYRAVNGKQREVFYEIVHPDFVNHGGASGDIVGPKALVDSLDPFFAAMPDWHVSEDYVVAQGDRVASRGTITGTHLGSFMGIPPTGKKLSWTGIIIYRLDDDGKVIERWQDFDAMGMLTQMGVIPPMG